MGTSFSKPRRYNRVGKDLGSDIPASALDGSNPNPRVARAEPVQHPPPCYDDDYYDVVGSDAGNLTVFSWITQVTTCCASVCTLIILMIFVIWFIVNDGSN
jgi:hypothetical protein